jgi:hypothetical protein
MELTIIQSRIYELRGVRVMLDYDLAKMYGMETKRLKEQVRRNRKRFPSDFMFEVGTYELENLRSQIVTSSEPVLKRTSDDSPNLRSQNATSSWGGSRYPPMAFTEQGVAMLSSVLNSDIAIEINIAIMRAFVEVRRALTTGSFATRQEIQKLQTYIEEVITDQNDINEDTRLQLELINQSLAAMQTKEKLRRPIGYL